MIKFLFLALVTMTPAFNAKSDTVSSAEVSASGRHIYILQPSVDLVFGSYMFAVDNKAKQAVTASLAVMLPEEKLDFRPEQGIEAKDLVLAGDGHADLLLKKEFKPGSHLLGLSFQLGANEGESTLSLTITHPVTEFLVMTPVGSLSLKPISGFTAVGVQAFAGQNFNTLRLTDPQVGTSYKLAITGVPEGRRRFWYLGFGTALVLLLAGLSLAYIARPKILVGASE